MTQTPFVPLNTVAKYFQVSESTVRGWIKQKRIPKNTYIHVGQTYRYNLPAIEEALLEHASPITKPPIDASEHTWGEMSAVGDDGEIPPVWSEPVTPLEADDDY